MKLIKTIILTTIICSGLNNLFAAELSPKKDEILERFKEEFDRVLYKPNRNEVNPDALLGILQKYTTTYPGLVRDFVTIDFSSGSNMSLLPMLISVTLDNAIFLNVVKYLVEKMGADVNATTVNRGSTLDLCKINSEIYKYLKSKGAKHEKEFKQRQQ